MGHWPLGLGD